MGSKLCHEYVNLSSFALLKTILHYTKVFKTVTIRESDKTTKESQTRLLRDDRVRRMTKKRQKSTLTDFPDLEDRNINKRRSRSHDQGEFSGFLLLFLVIFHYPRFAGILPSVRLFDQVKG